MPRHNVRQLPHVRRAVAAMTATASGRKPAAESTLVASATVAPVVRMSSMTMTRRPSSPADDLIFSAPVMLSDRSRADSPDWSATRRAWTRAELTVQSMPMDLKALALACASSPIASCPRRMRLTRVDGMGTRVKRLPAGAAKHAEAARKWLSTLNSPNWPSSLNCASAARNGPSCTPEATGTTTVGLRSTEGAGRGQATCGCGVSRAAHSSQSVIAGRRHPAQEAPMIRSAAATRKGSTANRLPYRGKAAPASKLSLWKLSLLRNCMTW